MRINDVDYGPIWFASGADGFDGEGYWFHKPYSLIPGFTKEGFTFVSKTITTFNNPGNMPLRNDWTPRELSPKCIWWNFQEGIGLNAVGLSNFGAEHSDFSTFWRDRTDPFMVSWMPVTDDPVKEAREFVKLMKKHPIMIAFMISYFFAFQINFTCPSTGKDLKKLLKKLTEILKIFQDLGVPLIVKLNVTTEPETVAEMHEQVPFDALCMSNTIPFGTEVLGIDWEQLIGSQSPLERRGLKGFPGGLSGSVIYPIVKDWVRRADGVLDVPINFCGGVDSPERVKEALSLPNVQSVSVATAIPLRPWRLKEMVAAAHAYRPLQASELEPVSA